jgi:hypothetical protein
MDVVSEEIPSGLATGIRSPAGLPEGVFNKVP